MFSKKSDELPSSTPPANPGRDRMASKSNSTFSVLGSDLTITGDIQASADLHIDGSVEGDIARLQRYNPDKSTQDWEANRYWVSVHLHPQGGPVPNYITLRGGPREVEIGRFLDEAERLTLYDDLKRALKV